jgi:hypothetical protein
MAGQNLYLPGKWVDGRALPRRGAPSIVGVTAGALRGLVLPQVAWRPAVVCCGHQGCVPQSGEGRRS